MEMKSKKAKIEETAFSDEESGQSSSDRLYREEGNIPLKKLLQRYLAEIVTTNYALKLCDLLIKAQDDRDCQILCDIQNILKEGSVDELVKLIFKALCASDANEFALKLKFLLKDSGKGSRRPAECINLLIENMEKLVDLFGPKDILCCSIDLEEEHKKSLETLKKFILREGKFKAGDLLSTIFKIGNEKVVFSPEERKKVVGLMLNAMPYTATLIKAWCSHYERVKLVGCQKRSALQFIKDLFSNYYDNSVILVDFNCALDEAAKDLEDSLFCVAFFQYYGSKEKIPDDDDCEEKISDDDDSEEMIPDDDSEEKIPDDDDSEEEIPDNEYDGSNFWAGLDFGDSDSDSDRETLEHFTEAGGLKVPKEHTWWNDYKNKFIH